MLSLLEMASVKETKRIEKEVVAMAELMYPGFVANACDGGGGVRTSEKYPPRFFLYICFEA